jgi:hypothetical protein
MRAITVLASAVLALAWTPVSLPAEDAAHSLPENWYVTVPWARQPPVNVYHRVAAVQSALGGLHNALNDYSHAIQAQADAHNQRVYMQAELARVEASQHKPEPGRSNFSTRGTPEEIDAAARARGPRATGVPNVSPGVLSEAKRLEEQRILGFQLGETAFEALQVGKGWGNAVLSNAPE